MTALPATPFDEQQIVYLADATDGVLWPFVYRSGSASDLKWEAAGPSPLTDWIPTAQAPTMQPGTVWRRSGHVSPARRRLPRHLRGHVVEWQRRLGRGDRRVDQRSGSDRELQTYQQRARTPTTTRGVATLASTMSRPAPCCGWSTQVALESGWHGPSACCPCARSASDIARLSRPHQIHFRTYPPYVRRRLEDRQQALDATWCPGPAPALLGRAGVGLPLPR